MHKKDCFFKMDGHDIPDDDRRMHCFCVDCVIKENMEDVWLWEGSKKGYGNFVYQCEICNVIIHQPEKND